MISAKLRERALLYLDSGRMSTFGGELQAAAFDAGLRSRASWQLPVITALLGALLYVVLCIRLLDREPQALRLVRIIPFDVGLFLFASFSGWAMARRWRSDTSRWLDLLLTDARPRHILQAMIARPIAPWIVCLCIFVAVELSLAPALLHSRSMYAPGTTNGVFGSVASALSTAVLVCALAFSHFESIRLAHVLHARAALPSIPVGELGYRLAFRGAAIVLALLAVGFFASAIATLAAFFVLAAIGVLSPWMAQPTISLACALSLWFVIHLKRVCTESETRDFVRDLLLHQRFGSAEVEHPSSYPAQWVTQAVHEAGRIKP